MLRKKTALCAMAVATFYLSILFTGVPRSQRGSVPVAAVHFGRRRSDLHSATKVDGERARSSA